MGKLLKVTANGQDNRPGLNRRGRQRTIDPMRVLELKLKNGLSHVQVAEIIGCSDRTIANVMRQFKGLLESTHLLDAYQEHRAKLFSAAEFELLTDLMDEKKRESASLNNTAYAFQQVMNARRLEEGKSTSNVSYAQICTDLEAVRKRKEELKVELAKLNVGKDTTASQIH